MSKPIVTGIFEGFRVLVDPDDPSRKPGPVTVYVMTNEQREKYMSKGEDKKMAIKEAEVRKIETAETEFYSGRLKFMRYTIHSGIITIIRDNPDNSTCETLKLRETELDTLATDLMDLIDSLAMYNTAAKKEAEK